MNQDKVYSFCLRRVPMLGLALVILFPACERDFSLDAYRDRASESMLVVNSILNPDSILKVSVTHPYFFSHPHTSYPPVQGLDVCVEDGDGGSTCLVFDEAVGLYIADCKPLPGQQLRLRVNGDGCQVAACDTIPMKVEIESVEVTGEGPVHIYWDSDYRFTYKITFLDPTGEENFYFLAVQSDALAYEFSPMGQVDYTVDYVFNVLAEMINKDIQGWRPDGVFGYPFSDKGIEGRRYTITVTEVLQTPLVQLIERLPRIINLYSISRSYFEYMVSVLSQDYDQAALKGNLLSLGLFEPTRIYTNIQSGAGIFGCYNLSSHKLDLLRQTGGWPSPHP